MVEFWLPDMAESEENMNNYFTDKNGYRWEIYDNESGYSVTGKDGREQYSSKKEATANMTDCYNQYADKIYYGL